MRVTCHTFWLNFYARPLMRMSSEISAVVGWGRLKPGSIGADDAVVTWSRWQLDMDRQTDRYRVS